MKDLVQKLREASEFECAECALHYVAYDDKMESWKCCDISCIDCFADSLNALADRIEAEYDPKPEPDTVEKVARELLKDLELVVDRENPVYIDQSDIAVYAKRLDHLGVNPYD